MLNLPPNTRVAIEGHKGLFRDLSSMAIINTDINAFKKRRAVKAKMIKDKEEITKANEEIQNLRRDMDELKTMLKRFLINNHEQQITGIQNITTTVVNT